MRYFFPLFSCLVLSACVSSTVSSDQIEQAVQFHSTDYILCNKNAATALAHRSGDPFSLAVAAENQCRRQWIALRQAYYDKLGPTSAMDLGDRVQASSIRSNVAIIARIRAS